MGHRQVNRIPDYFDAEKAAKYLERLTIGAYIEVAAASAGIQKMTLYGWLRNGRLALIKGRTQKLDAGEQILADFVDACDKAIADSELRMAMTVAKAGTKDWKAAMELLKHRYAERYGPKQRNPEDLSKLTNEELVRRAREEADRLEAVGEKPVEPAASDGKTP